jgi:hypothetical protein
MRSSLPGGGLCLRAAQLKIQFSASSPGIIRDVAKSWPKPGDQSERVMLSHEELSLLLGGIDLTRARRKNWYRKEIELHQEV